MQIQDKRAPGRRKKVYFNKGRQLDLDAYNEANELLEKFKPLEKDMLIEYLHLFNDKYKGLYAKHLKAISELTRLSMAEVYEVASFYAHFKIIDTDQLNYSDVTIKVCDSITCYMNNSDDLLKKIKNDHPNLRIERAPCMGRCDVAPVVEVNHNHICRADIIKVNKAVSTKDFSYKNEKHTSLEDYLENGGYYLYKKLLEVDDQVIEALKHFDKARELVDL